MKGPTASTIRASEIGSYLYCRRAWWYQQSGEESQNQAEMHTGTQIHEQHGRTVLAAGLFRWAGYAFLLLGLALAAIYLVNLLI